MAVGVRRVARAHVLGAAVERQEAGVLSGEARRQQHEVGVDGEVDERPPGEDQRFGSRSVRYCSFASRTVWCVSGFFSSAVATGMPLTNRPRSSSFPLVAS